MPKCLWLTAGTGSGPIKDGTDHMAASMRYRVLIPARMLAQSGVASDALNPDDLAAGKAPDLSGYAGMVIGKYAHTDPATAQRQSSQLLAMLDRARARGLATIADVCDDRFDHALLGEYWRRLVSEVDRVVTSTPLLAEITRGFTHKPVMVIPDPVEGPGGAARFLPPQAVNWPRRLMGARPRALKLLWYGHQSNSDELAPFLERLGAWLASQRLLDRIEMQAVTAAGFGVENLARQCSAIDPARLQMNFIAWSLTAQRKALEDCDMVVIPATLETRDKQVKSANRLTEALWAGRAVFAHPVPSYLDFIDHAWISEDIVTGIAAALRDPGRIERQIRAGQDLVRQRHLPESIGAAWLSVLQDR